MFEQTLVVCFEALKVSPYCRVEQERARCASKHDPLESELENIGFIFPPIVEPQESQGFPVHRGNANLKKGFPDVAG